MPRSIHLMSECSIDGCARYRVARGWCHTHYEMWRRRGDPVGGRKYADNRGACSIQGCAAKARCQTLCDKHYTRLRQHGDPHIILVRRAWTIGERFEADIDRSGPTSCWIWRGPHDGNGYGRLYIAHGKFLSVHRYAYEQRFGAIPDGLDLDHICRVKDCANPDHLQAVSHAENCLRGIGVHAQNARKTHCKWGHKFDDENTARTPEGFRKCKACKREYQAKLRARRRSLPVAG